MSVLTEMTTPRGSFLDKVPESEFKTPRNSSLDLAGEAGGMDSESPAPLASDYLAGGFAAR